MDQQTNVDASAARGRRVLAIIPYYKAPEKLEKCLAALAASTVPVTPFVHDNNVNNIGYTRATNVGLRKAFEEQYDYAFLLNQDCYVYPETMSNLLSFMESHPRCGLAGVKQLLAHDLDTITHGGCTVAFPRGRHHFGRKSRGDCAVSAKMPWVNGAAMLARMSAVFEFGMLDANMYLIASDADWCYTCRARGWECWYCAEAEVIHETGISAATPSTETERMMMADQTYFRDKWIGTLLYHRLSHEFDGQSNAVRVG